MVACPVYHLVYLQKLSGQWIWNLPVANKEQNWGGSLDFWHGLTGGF